jgi:hypothetical protein
MANLCQKFDLSHMTVVRALKKVGYYTSYNHNAAYYVLHDVPQFDSWGLWAYRNIRFSRYGTLPETVVAVVEQALAGMTIVELEERLGTKVGNVSSRLVSEGRIDRQIVDRRRVVYLACDPKTRKQQQQQRQELAQQEGAGLLVGTLPEGCSAEVVIEVLREMIVAPKARPDQLTRKLKRHGVQVTTRQVRGVMAFYGLEKKRPRSSWPG